MKLYQYRIILEQQNKMWALNIALHGITDVSVYWANESKKTQEIINKLVTKNKKESE